MGKALLKYLLFGITAMVVFLPHYYLPVLQRKFVFLQAEPLVGEYQKGTKPVFWPRKWLSKDYQKAYENYVRDRNVAAPFLVRLHTQLYYDWLNVVPHDNIVAGRSGYLYTKTDCEAFAGRNIKDISWPDSICRKLKTVIDHFGDSTQFLVMIPPGKPSILPEYLPPFYENINPDTTYRAAFQSSLEKYNIPFLDFEYFKSIKTQTEYPLYPKAGLHWSHYGLTLAADSMRNYISDQLNIPVPHMQWRDSILMKTQLRGPDKELIGGANFLHPPDLGAMPYPAIRYRPDSLQQKPQVLVVGDSYYLLMYEYGLQEGLFGETSAFWYYNQEIKPAVKRDGKLINADALNLLEEIAKRELVIIVTFETNLDRFGFNFIEQVYNEIAKPH